MAVGTPTWGAWAPTNGSAPSPAAPASTPAGGLLIAVCYSRGAAVTFSRTGWTTHLAAQTANGSLYILLKDAVGTEGGIAQAMTCTGNTSGTTGTTIIARVGYIPTTNVSQAVAGSYELEAAVANGSVYSHAAVAPTIDGSMVVFIVGKTDGQTGNSTTELATWANATNPLSWTGASLASTAGADATLGIATAVQSTPGDTGALSVISNGVSTTGLSYAFILAPAFAGAGVCAAVGSAAVLGVLLPPLSPTPSLTSLSSNPIEAGTLLTIEGTASVASFASGSSACELTTSSTLTVDIGLVGATSLTVGSTATLAVAGLFSGTATLELTSVATLQPSWAQTPAPILGSVDPNPVAPGAALTVTGGVPSSVLLASSATCALSSTATLNTAPPLNYVMCAGSTSLVLTGTATLGILPRAPTPILTSVTPDPVTPPAALTVDATTIVNVYLAGISAPALSTSAPIAVVQDIFLSTASSCSAAATGAVLNILAGAILIPATLYPASASSVTATVSGNDIIFGIGQYVEYLIDAGATGGLFTLLTTLTPDAPGVLALQLDSQVVGFVNYP